MNREGKINQVWEDWQGKQNSELDRNMHLKCLFTCNTSTIIDIPFV